MWYGKQKNMSHIQTWNHKKKNEWIYFLFFGKYITNKWIWVCSIAKQNVCTWWWCDGNNTFYVFENENENGKEKKKSTTMRRLKTKQRKNYNWVWVWVYWGGNIFLFGFNWWCFGMSSWIFITRIYAVMHSDGFSACSAPPLYLLAFVCIFETKASLCESKQCA